MRLRLWKLGRKEEKRENREAEFELCCRALPPFQSLASWTEGRQGSSFQNDVKLSGGIPEEFVAI